VTATNDFILPDGRKIVLPFILPFSRVGFTYKINLLQFRGFIACGHADKDLFEL
jgi:hypothetical protein